MNADRINSKVGKGVRNEWHYLKEKGVRNLIAVHHASPFKKVPAIKKGS